MSTPDLTPSALLRAMVLAATQGKRSVGGAVLAELLVARDEENRPAVLSAVESVLPERVEPLLAAGVLLRTVLDGGAVVYYFSPFAAGAATGAAVDAVERLLSAQSPVTGAAPAPRPITAAPHPSLGPRPNLTALVEAHVDAALAEADRLRRYAEGVRALADDLDVCASKRGEGFR